MGLTSDHKPNNTVVGSYLDTNLKRFQTPTTWRAFHLPVRYIYVPADSRNIAKKGKSDDKLEPSESSENI
jgi:hypothetical protein